MTMKMIERFRNREVLVEELLGQKIIRGQRPVAEALADGGELVEYAPGAVIIEQGASDRSIFFLLSGKAMVIVNGIRLYPREAGNTVGEMSAVNSSIPRSATIEALEPVVALKVDHTSLVEIGNRTNDVWRLLAQELASRLEQRNKFVNRANQRPRIFIISSSEADPIARTLRVGLSKESDVTVWNDELVFPPSGYPVEVLEREVNLADFGIALAEPDDLVFSRDRTSATPRDNVIFELGFFMSRLGRHRTILLVPRQTEIKLPSDFKGLIPLEYESAADPKTRAELMGPAIDRIRNVVDHLKVRTSFSLIQ
jgi:predicted nucleotide-binding protein